MTESPQWKRPSDIMKNHRKKKRISLQRLPSSEAFASEVFGDLTNSVSVTQSKRRNPFSTESTETSQPALKRQRQSLDDSSQDSSDKLAFFKTVFQTNKTAEVNGIQIEKTTPSFNPEEDDSCSQFEFVTKFFSADKKKVETQPVNKEEVKKEEATSSTWFPVDWSIKNKMRVVSTSALTWCTQLKTMEEATGVTGFVSGQMTDDDKSEFQSCGLYWTYPNFPWMRMFPRIVPENNIKRSAVDLFTDEVQKSLQNEWTESFSSAFHQMRAQQCPYFYVCTHQFTVLFRARGIAGQTSMCALLTPTTRGLRESLRNEDIEFTMPVLENKKRKSIEGSTDAGKENQETVTSKSTSDPRDDEEEDEDLIDTDEGAHVWLESIGLDKKSFPSLDPNKVKIQREGFRAIDNRPESLVCVEGTNVHGLFNFLLNCRSCVASSGPQAGVPPTILSPSPFKGATLKSQKVKHSIARQPDTDGSVRQVHILEVAGPVLPHNIHRVSSLLQRTQNNDFSLTFNTHEPSYPFNVKCSQENEDSPDVRQTLHMEDSKFSSFFSGQCIADRLTSIHELVCDKGGYSWVS